MLGCYSLTPMPVLPRTFFSFVARRSFSLSLWTSPSLFADHSHLPAKFNRTWCNQVGLVVVLVGARLNEGTSRMFGYRVNNCPRKRDSAGERKRRKEDESKNGAGGTFH